MLYLGLHYWSFCIYFCIVNNLGYIETYFIEFWSVSRKVRSKWLSLHKQWHKCLESKSGLLFRNAKIKSHYATQNKPNRSMSITVILPIPETTNSLFPIQKQNTTSTYFFRGLYDVTNYRQRLRIPQLYLCRLHLQVALTTCML